MGIHGQRLVEIDTERREKGHVQNRRMEHVLVGPSGAYGTARTVLQFGAEGEGTQDGRAQDFVRGEAVEAVSMEPPYAEDGSL